MNDTLDTVLVVLAGILVIGCALLLSAWLLRWLWNRTMPEVFGWKQITFWQAFRLQLICWLLFGVSRSLPSTSVPAASPVSQTNP